MSEPAGIWLRVSSGGQDEANQEPDVLRHCAEHDYDVKARYVVHGKSAYHGKQQADLDKAIADMRAGKIKVLVIWHSDRIERREGKALMDVLAEFVAAGGRVESTQEPMLGAVDFGGQVLTFIAGLINHEKSKHISAQVGLANDRIHENGALHGRPPFGYTSTGTKYHREMLPTDEGRACVPQIFERVIKGDSLATVAAWLTVETGRGWWPKSVGVLLRNPVYMGHRCEWDVKTRTYGKTIHRCESLVDATTFRKAGEALDGRPKRGPMKPEGRAMLAGALYCPRCADSPMYRITTGKPGNRHTYYRCSGRGVARKGCGNMVQLAGVDAEVDRTMRKDFDIPVMVRKLIPGHDATAELEGIRFEIRQLAARDLEDDVYDAELAALRAERDCLRALPVVPDQVKDVPGDWTYAERWSALAVEERGPWLVTQGFRVTASTDGVSVGITIPVLEVTRETGELQLRVYPAPENEVAVSPAP